MIRKKINYILLLILILTKSKLLLGVALSQSKFAVPEHLKGNNASVFTLLQPLENDYNLVNLGSGTPDFEPPAFLRRALTNAVWGNYTFSQYTRSYGEERLVKAIAKFYSKFINRTLDPYDNVFITLGATEAIYATITSHTSPGDEWIIIEPYYDIYIPIIKASYGIPRLVTLKLNNTSGTPSSSDWTFDRKEMASAFNNKTKAILINTPNNPTGKVFTREELEFIADLAKKWDTLVVTDEVYEFLVYDNKEHIRMASLPDMFERTITACSGSKTFSATGYRIGWAYGGAEVLNNLRFIQRQILDCVPTLIQEAYAVTFEQLASDLGKPYSYLNILRKMWEEKRNYLLKIISDFGMSPIIPDAGYFLIANLTTLGDTVNFDEETGTEKDYKFVKWMIKNVQIEGFPLSGFYSSDHKHLGEDGVRFTFIKNKQTLDKAASYVQKWKSKN